MFFFLNYLTQVMIDHCRRVLELTVTYIIKLCNDLAQNNNLILFSLIFKMCQWYKGHL